LDAVIKDKFEADTCHQLTQMRVLDIVVLPQAKDGCYNAI
jgi:hypothetical protein